MRSMCDWDEDEERARDAGRMKTTGTSAQAAQATSLCKTYGAGQAAVRALRDVNATFERGLFTAVMGCQARGSRRSCTVGRPCDLDDAREAVASDELTSVMQASARFAMNSWVAAGLHRCLPAAEDGEKHP
jgi:hypothetical protein